jgi:hypothetical protein
VRCQDGRNRHRSAFADDDRLASVGHTVATLPEPVQDAFLTDTPKRDV